MIYLLDTCLISELIKEKPEPQVVNWVRQQPEERLYLSVLTLGELQKGIAKLQGSKRARRLQAWLDDDLLERFAGRILDLTPGVARIWGRIQGKAELVGEKMQVIDSLIAATALDRGASVVTRNVDDMAPSGVEIVNPWLSEE
ncbi:MAG: type II toxin-antitoxin system VapC family toxin [bacterium]|nr:type II toxin-antitoxin system VapC family toxin [bacterium]